MSSSIPVTEMPRVYTGSECRLIDQYAINELGISGISLMRRAAKFAAVSLLQEWPKVSSVSVVCGSGNNAGDGYLMASELKNKQMDVEVIQVGDTSKLKGDAKAAYESLGQLGLTPVALTEFKGDIVVDALLGTGATGTLRNEYIVAVDQINRSSKPVCALDLPTGINAETGGFLVEKPVIADLTVCFVGPKLALLTGPARNYAGQILTSDLEIPTQAFEQANGIELIPGSTTSKHLPRRLPASHKGNFGHVLVVGGNSGMGGATLLASEACLRTAVGLVTLVTHSTHAAALMARRPELMVVGSELGEFDTSLCGSTDVLVVGPGLGRNAWSERVFDRVLSSSCGNLVVDADGLYWLAREQVELPPSAILTPHPGEAANLLQCSIADVENDRVSAAKELSSRYRATTILKGAGTLVADSGKVVGLCPVAEPALSTAGSGDVLSGVVAGALAQLERTVEASLLGVHLHAQAGIRAQKALYPRSVIAGDLIEAIHPFA